MTHVIVGYPSLAATEHIVKIMDSLGVSYIELQIPFSDPLADGPTIMKACEASLANGTKVNDAFILAKKLSKQVSTKLLFMAYFNTVFTYGVEKFCKDAKDAGIAGLIVPDMPLDEEPAEQFSSCLKKHDLLNIRVLSPASTKERIEKNAKIGTGFVYCTARQGITGVSGKTLDARTIEYLKLVKKEFVLPLAVGFGISEKKHIDMLRGVADIAVIGSAIVDLINKSNKEHIEKDLTKFITALGV